MKILRVLLWIQSLYILITAVWPLIDIGSFMLVTGYKTEIWLVKTVGALLIPISLCMFTYLFIEKTDYRPVMVLGGATAIAFIIVDFYYALTDVIANIYIADGVLQIGFLVAWIFVGLKKQL